MLLFIEMELTDGVQVEGSQMISPAHISEVEELGANVRLHMVSGNSYVVTGDSFGAMLNGIQDAKYLKIDRTPKEEVVEEVKEVEGELVE